jgi:hypothetical protein
MFRFNNFDRVSQLEEIASNKIYYRHEILNIGLNSLYTYV